MKIFLIGFMGAGKTTVGKKLASLFKYRFIDTDSLIIEKVKMPVTQIFKESGEDFFRKSEHEVIKEIAGWDENLVVSTGGGAPCFMNNMDIMKSSGVTVYLKIEPDVLFNRLSRINRKSRPLIANQSRDGLYAYIIEKLTDREPYYSRSEIIITGRNIRIDFLAREIIKFIDHIP